MNKKKLIIPLLMIAPFFGVLSETSYHVLASPGGIQFQWDPDPNFKKLKSFQTSEKRMERAYYYFFMRERTRKTGILKLTIKVPDYFKAKIKPENLILCRAEIGGFRSRTRCVEEIPAVFEVAENQNEIDVFPDQPIPVNSKTYAVSMKIKNPKKSGMFQFHGYAQSPGAMPMATYMGTWSFSVK